MNPRSKRRAPQVGNGISAPSGVWTFGGDTPHAFDRHIRRSVPAYAECHDLILDIADQLVPAGGRCYDLGCSTGTLTASLAERLAPRGAEIIGVDREPQMIERAGARLENAPSTRFLACALEELELEPADVAVCFYTMQFVSPRQRDAVLGRIRSALEPHGALIQFEKVLAPTGRGQEVAEGAYFDFKRRQGFTNDEIAGKTRSLRGVLCPLSAEENYAMLRRAGFGEVIHVFRWLVFDGVVAFANPASEPG